MKNDGLSRRAEILRFLPSIDSILQTRTARSIAEKNGAKMLTAYARRAVETLRREILKNNSRENSADWSKEKLLAEAEKLLAGFARREQNTRFGRVINATGVIIHTNLGRAPLAEAARQAIFAEAARYCALEYDLETGRRGKRGARAEQLLAELTGAEAALIVNNCAAACILVLTALAQGGEAILSRGEMVEIGGDFRIPDVMEQSGAILREVGATNKTRISDYEKAITADTRLILKVHPSNYRIIGFTAAPTVAELAALARRNNLLLYEDAGSGALVDLAEFGLPGEPVIAESIKAGADVVTFSGDKLLGAVQSGLIVGKREIIERLRAHPFYRALRADKIVYAALEATLEIYRRESYAEIPVWRMLALTEPEIRIRAQIFADKLRAGLTGKSGWQIEIVSGNSVIGGGCAPEVQPPTALLSLICRDFSAGQLEEKLRFSQPPVIARIADDKILLDLRTVFADEEAGLLEILLKLS